MTRYLAVALIGATLGAGLPMLSGCEKKEESKTEQTTKNPDGSSSKDVEKTTTNPKTGDTKTTTEHKVTGPSSQP